MNQVADPVPAYRCVYLVPGPVEDKGFSLYRLQLNKFPEPAVITVVPIVPHYEQRVCRHSYHFHVVAALFPRGKYFIIKENSVAFIL